MLRVQDVMTRELITLTPSCSLKEAREVMGTARIRHIPVVSPKGGFVGLVTKKDLMQATVSSISSDMEEVWERIEQVIPISEIMTREVTCVAPETPLPEAGRIIIEKKYDCLPVVEDGRLVGILTTVDFVKACERLLVGRMTVAL